MLDRRTPYVMVTMDNETGEVWGDKDLGDGLVITIGMRFVKENGETYLRYTDVGPSHPHMQPGKVLEELENGIVFDMPRMRWTCTFTELTMEQFEKHMRRHLDPAVSDMIHDLDDVYTWIRHVAGMN